MPSGISLNSPTPNKHEQEKGKYIQMNSKNSMIHIIKLLSPDIKQFE